jgi:hypothetical protein
LNETRPPYSPAPYRRYVVVVESDLTRRAHLSEQLVKLGFVPLVAASMQEGIALAAAHGLRPGPHSIITGDE